MIMDEMTYCVCAYTDVDNNSKLLGFIDAGIEGFTPYDDNVPRLRYLVLSGFFRCEMDKNIAYLLAAFLNTFYRDLSAPYYFKVMQKLYIYKNIGEIEDDVILY